MPSVRAAWLGGGAWRSPFRGLPREVPILSAISFTVALGYGIVAPAIPAFARQFGVSVTAAASVISIFALMRVIGALPAGRLVDRFGEPWVMAAGITVDAALLPAGRVADTRGRRPVVIGGCVIAAAGMAMLALLPGLWAYLAALATAGFGSGLLDVAPSAMIGDILGRRGGTMVAFYQMAGDVGAVVGPVAAGLLVDSASYAAAFGLAGGVLGAAAMLAFLAPETRRGGVPAPAG